MSATALPTQGVERPPRSPTRIVLTRLAGNSGAIFGGSIVIACIVLAVFAGPLAPFDPVKTDWLLIRKPPSAAHWLGTDELGRDILSRLIYGARASLLAGAVSVGIAFLLGTPVGLCAGFFGGPLDSAVMRVVDSVLSIPFLILAIAFAAFLGPSLGNVMIAIGISFAPLFARLARGQALMIKNEEYVEAAESMGAPGWFILIRHVFPNALPPLIVQSTLAVASAIIAESALAFLGLGQQPPAASWGTMLNSAKQALDTAPWMAVSPGLAILLLVVGFNFLGDALADALDPKG